MKRFYETAMQAGAETVIRITADCPFVDPSMLDDMLVLFHSSPQIKFVSNQTPPSFPDGLDIDIFNFALLENAHQNATSDFDREHVTPFMKRLVGAELTNYSRDADYPEFRITLDTETDYRFLSEMIRKLDYREDFSWKEVVNLILHDENLAEMHELASLEKLSGELKPSQKLYSRAKRIIPGGTSFFSKRPENSLPLHWPTYYERAAGFSIWSYDGLELWDFGLMGVGTNTLGYANPAIDKAVISAVQSGNMSTLNCPEEVFLAERLIDLHPWSSRAKFARTGAEINSMALRIARAASGRTKVAICGYHGWHDWYLATNIASPDALQKHLLSGLSVKGVPKVLGSEISSFVYNDTESFDQAINDPAVGVVFMEVLKSVPPKVGFLEHIRKKTHEKGIVLIFDECSSGFRETFGGIHKQFGVLPDLATFGKALGNGYAITALLGIDSVMEEAESSFISSTFWSERIGYVAALATLDEMEKIRSWEYISSIGQNMRSVWAEAFRNNGFNYSINGVPAATSFILEQEHQVLKTYITQEMLSRFRILTGNLFYPSTAHKPSDIDLFGEKFESVISRAKQLLESNELNSAINGPISHVSFGRLN